MYRKTVSYQIPGTFWLLQIRKQQIQICANLLDNKHSTCPMENIMGIIRITNKGKMLDITEKCYIYKETRINNQINKCTVKPNIVFETNLRHRQSAYNSITTGSSVRTSVTSIDHTHTHVSNHYSANKIANTHAYS